MMRLLADNFDAAASNEAQDSRLISKLLFESLSRLMNLLLDALL